MSNMSDDDKPKDMGDHTDPFNQGYIKNLMSIKELHQNLRQRLRLSSPLIYKHSLRVASRMGGAMLVDTMIPS